VVEVIQLFNKETTAMFIGHRDCHGLDKAKLEAEIVKLIEKGVTTFLSGGMGRFDMICEHIVGRLQQNYPHIRLYVVMPYPTFHPAHVEDAQCLVLPEGLEKYHPKAAIVKRNRWMVERSAFAVCYVCYSWGGAAQTLQYAQKQGLTCIFVSDSI
jgi:uncharacterized phage-like protein YoqJ